MKKVGITGQSGFMGTHLYNFLGTKLEKILPKNQHIKRKLLNF